MTMLLEEQTVVLLGRTTAFTAICEACVQDQLAELGGESWVGANVSGSLAVEHDRGWASCARGHRVRLLRAGRAAGPLLH
jgi:hypothetical protein